LCIADLCIADFSLGDSVSSARKVRWQDVPHSPPTSAPPLDAAATPTQPSGWLVAQAKCLKSQLSTPFTMSDTTELSFPEMSSGGTACELAATDGCNAASADRRACAVQRAGDVAAAAARPAHLGGCECGAI